jgi:hypothetical protein
MHHLNYCRQMAASLEWNASENPRELVRKECRSALAFSRGAVKFILPTGGRVLVDPSLRGLAGVDRLCLPFPTIALEFALDDGGKHVVLAREAGDNLEMQRVICTGKDAWTPTCTLRTPRENWRDDVGLPVVFVDDPECPWDIAIEAPVAVISMLNALACSNVHIERSAATKTRKALRKKGALPFDDYHILTVDAYARSNGPGSGPSGRSPREHLRRGHIRRLESGACIWVNATVVNAGIGGKISKDYALKHGSTA